MNNENNEFLVKAVSAHGNQKAAHDLLDAIEIERRKPKVTHQISELQIAVLNEKGKNLKNLESSGEAPGSEE